MSSSSSTAETAATLTDATTWKLRFVLRGLPTTKGRKVDEIFNIHAKFIQEDGYEPPQGHIEQQVGTSSTTATNNDDGDDDKAAPQEQQSRFQLVSSRWKLSEDPNDRKWGLWIWGLSEEPLYPFMLLQLKTDRIPLPGVDEDSIEPLALFAQVTHKRDPEKGAVLSRAEVKIRLMETVKADVFGVASADIYEEKTIGQCVFQPLINENDINDNK